MNKCPICKKDIKQDLLQSNKDPNVYMCYDCKQKEMRDNYNEMIKKRQQEHNNFIKRYMMLNKGGNK